MRRTAGSLFSAGGAAAASGSGGGGVPAAAAIHGPLVNPAGSGAGDACGRGAADPDAWLDKVAEPGCAPKIEPSWYAQVHGIEPYERADVGNFQLHVVPTDDWYDTAKRATDRCDLEVTHSIQNGARAASAAPGRAADAAGSRSPRPAVLLVARARALSPQATAAWRTRSCGCRACLT